MRTLFLLIFLWLGASAIASADEQVVQRFDGHTSLTTSDFTVPDHWEIRWRSAQALSVGVIKLDNTVVSGATGVNSGSLYLPKGGSYRIRVKGEDPIPWDIAVVALGANPTASGTEPSSFYVPTAGPEFIEDTNASPANNPAPAAPDTNAPPPAPPPVPTQLTAAQQQAVVMVKGDREEGAGFLLKTAAGPVVVTSLRLISNNPRLEITTKAGSDVKMTTLQCAPDRDLAMIGIENNGYPCLEKASDIVATAQPGDAVLTSASTTPSDENASVAQVVTVTPKHIEISDFQSHGEIGGPILHAKSGQVIAMVGATSRIAITTGLDKTSFPSREAAVARSMSYFGLRFDTVAHWETCDWKRFNVETAFLDAFRQRSRCLDSYLNGLAGDSRPEAKLYESDEKVKAAHQRWVESSAGGDSSQRMEALRALLFDLGTVADADMDQIQQPANFYSFDQQRARDEIAYRNALKAQLDSYNNDLPRFDTVAHRNN